MQTNSRAEDAQSGVRGSGRRDGRRALVLGASSGIGLAAAELLAKSSSHVALVARGAGLEVAASRVRDEGAAAHFFEADATDPGQLEAAIDGAEASMGGIDVAVLNIGAAAWGPFEEVSREDFDRVLDVTFRSMVDATRILLPILRRSGGNLVYTGSVAGRLPMPMMSPYVAAKHALKGFVETLQLELAATGSPVGVAMVSPGPVDTPFWRHAATPAGRGPGAVPPLIGYDAESVAAEIVRVSRRPGRDVTVGGAMAVAGAAYRLGGPASAWLLKRIAVRLIRDRDGSERDRGTLARPTGEGMTRGGRLGRPSLLSALRSLPSRLASQANPLGHGS